MTIQSTARKGIPHLWFPSNSMEMKPLDFLDFIKLLRSHGGIISNKNTNLSEKIDGAGIRFGCDVDKKFFIESSRSGPIFVPKAFSDFAKAKFGSTNAIANGYDEIFDELDEDNVLYFVLNKYNRNGIKVIGEVLLNQFGVKHDTEPNLVRFVNTWYDSTKLGSFATFVLFTVQDSEGNTHESSDEIISLLKAISNDRIKFETADINEFEPLDFSKQIEGFAKVMKTAFDNDIDNFILKKKKDADVILYINTLQKILNDQLSALINKGKFGPNYEGLVFEFDNKVKFKITTETFKDAKRKPK
jgi:hypothetical protein